MALSAKSAALLLKLSLDTLERRIKRSAPHLGEKMLSHSRTVLANGRAQLEYLKKQAEQESQEELDRKTKELGKLLAEEGEHLDSRTFEKALEAYDEARVAQEEAPRQPRQGRPVTRKSRTGEGCGCGGTEKACGCGGKANALIRISTGKTTYWCGRDGCFVDAVQRR